MSRFNDSNLNGINTYSDDLFKTLKAYKLNAHLLQLVHKKYNLPKETDSMLFKAIFPFGQLYMNEIYWSLKRKLKLSNNIVHLVEPGLLNVFDPEKAIVTVHDLYYLQNRVRFSHKGLFDLFNRWVYEKIRETPLVISVSEYTKNALVEYLGISRNKIRVIPNIIDWNFFQPGEGLIRERFGIEENEVLLMNVSGIGKRKNFDLLLKVLKRLPRNYKLIHVGNLSNTSWKLLNRLDLQKRLLNFQSVSKEELKAWYRSADIYIQSSTYEGFGRPVAEALSCGKYVISTNRSSLPEILGSQGDTFEPEQESELYDLLISYIKEDKYSEELILNRRSQAQKYSGETNFLKLKETYEEADRLIR